MTAFPREGQRRPPLYLERNLMIVFSVTITAMMGVGSLTPAFPTIMHAFHISSQQVGLLITFFTLPGIVFAPVVGLLADRYGRKRVLVPSLLLFAFAGASCAFVPSFHWLLVLRFVQGTGGAALTALNNTLIGDLYSGRTRAEAIGYNASVQNMATLNNPMLGGLVALAGWRYPFFLPLFAVPVACFVAFGLRNPEPKGAQSFREYLLGAIKSIVNRRMITLCSANLVGVIVAFGALMVYLALLMKNRFDADPFTIGVVIASASFVSTLDVEPGDTAHPADDLPPDDRAGHAAVGDRHGDQHADANPVAAAGAGLRARHRSGNPQPVALYDGAGKRPGDEPRRGDGVQRHAQPDGPDARPADLRAVLCAGGDGHGILHGGGDAGGERGYGRLGARPDPDRNRGGRMIALARRKRGGERPLYLDRNLLILFCVTATAMLGTSTITPAFPLIMKAFHINSQQAGLLITFNTLPGIFLSPVAGILADRIGRKRVLVPSLILFAAAGSACVMTQSFTTLIVLRFLQGCAAAPLGALNNTVIGELFTGRRRMEAMGYNASVMSSLMLGYPILGGAVALAGWHWPFLLALIGLPAAWLVAFRLRNPEPKHALPMGEYVGSALRGIANRRMAALFLCNLMTVAVSFGVLIVYLTFLISSRFGGSPLEIGIIVGFSPVISTIMSTQAVRIRRLLTFRQMIVIGLVLSGAGISLNVGMPSLWYLLIPAFIRGLAQGVLNPSVNTLVAEFAPHDSRAAVMALNSTMFRIGQTIAPPIFGLIYAVGGMDVVFHAGTAILLITAVVVGFTMGDIDSAVERRHAAEAAGE